MRGIDGVGLVATSQAAGTPRLPHRSQVSGEVGGSRDLAGLLARHRLYRWGMRFLAIFALIALAEVATFFWVGSRIGLGWALGLAVLTALIGASLVRRAGLSVLSRLRQKTSQGQIPGRELSEGAAILVSGAFLISPGFITDVLGFLLLVPAVRGSIHGIVSRRLSGRISTFTARSPSSTNLPLSDPSRKSTDPHQ